MRMMAYGLIIRLLTPSTVHRGWLGRRLALRWILLSGLQRRPNGCRDYDDWRIYEEQRGKIEEYLSHNSIPPLSPTRTFHLNTDKIRRFLQIARYLKSRWGRRRVFGEGAAPGGDDGSKAKKCFTRGIMAGIGTFKNI